MSATITHLDSVADLNKTISSAGDKLVVIDFHATWCGPCHAIAPRYEALSKKYTNVIFTKSDVDKAQDVAQQYSVSAMPTFVFLKSGTKVDQVRGADPGALESAIKRHSSGGAAGGGGAAAAFTGTGQTLGGTKITSSTTSTGGQGVGGALSGLDPQVQILLGLVGLYVAYLYLY